MQNEDSSPQSLNMYLRKINIGIRRYMDKSDVKRQLDNVTGTHGYIVGYLKSREGEDVFQRDVEKHFLVRRSTASSILALMEKNGLIERRSVEQDARLKKIVLTEKADELITMFECERRELESILEKDFSKEELTLLKTLLGKVVDNLDSAKDGL